ncbi:FAD-dependent oxidoreductase [Bosea sp. TAB14]|uniref:FAD-dependent oxidoreductase n=1 Tax=Bosea sp. TAB14 TaxID=3237481 RepID=UPI003F903CEE
MAGSPDGIASAAAKDANVYDLVVIGGGGAGLTAALFGTLRGARVLLLESTEHVGGTTAFSGGTIWIPNTFHTAEVGTQDSVEQAETYLHAALGNYAAPDMIRAFLEAGPRAVELLDRETDVKLRPYPLHPDYISDLPGSTMKGRALEPVPFDGRLLGDKFDLIRPPIPEFTILNGLMVDRNDIAHLLNLKKSWASFRYSLALVARYARDRLSRKRGARLTMGNALIGRLLHSFLQRGGTVWTEAQVDRLIEEDGRIAGVSLLRNGGRQDIHAVHGVILASGGFNRNPTLRKELVPDAEIHTPGAPGHKGAALELALNAGARMGDRNVENVFWAPVSIRQRADGTKAVFPHFVFDRAKPGTIIVNKAGRRFFNESTSYHLTGKAMIEAHRNEPSIPAFLIADHQAIKTYGLGMVRPGGSGMPFLLKDGYLVKGETLAELASKLGVNAPQLQKTVETFNGYAATGIDPDFGRGTTAYQRNLGDPKHGPNPTMRALENGPFYAVKLYPGDIGASAGLVTDAHARVLGKDGPIAGLYAIGNDQNSIMAGLYPAPGITLGPAMTFAYIAVQNALAA